MNFGLIVLPIIKHEILKFSTIIVELFSPLILSVFVLYFGDQLLRWPILLMNWLFNCKTSLSLVNFFVLKYILSYIDIATLSLLCIFFARCSFFHHHMSLNIKYNSCLKKKKKTHVARSCFMGLGLWFCFCFFLIQSANACL